MKKTFKKYVLVFILLLVCPFLINRAHAEGSTPAPSSETCTEPSELEPEANSEPPKHVVKFMENNDCYKYGRKIVPVGIMIHSTACPGVMAKDWFICWNKSFRNGVGDEKGQEVCVHAFLDDKTVYQYLPWMQRGWHCGRAYPGGPSANDTHISIEICEPGGIKYDPKKIKIIEYDPTSDENKKYFEAIWKNAIWLCANLCQRFKINPAEIISHQEGHALGIASNHGDPQHWWRFHDKNMNMLRASVFGELMNRVFHEILKDDYARRYFLSEPTDTPTEIVRFYSLPLK